ncbi:MAG: NADH-quinone oxidoreductase subunit L [Chitinophagaceae bacterium]|nr:NADH-quinone oxidoreductase subunit L [Chitinophagaceae bacterium]
MMNLVWLVPFFPLIGFLITGLGRNQLGKSAGWIASLAILASFIVSTILFTEVKSIPAGSPVVVHLFDFINTGSMQIPFSLQIDALSSIFLMVITGIGFLIHLYSISYMGHDEGMAKFFSYLNLFVFSMLLLVLGANYLIMFIGWEGVGLCSYLLIGFWYKNLDYTQAARKAFVMNRIGDLGFLVGMFLLFSKYNTLDFVALQAAIGSGTPDVSFLTAVSLCFFVGATGKSAQVPLFTWLPDAMAGPTPVSALIHAATMVTAGVYMVSRSHFMFTLAPTAQQVILIIGLATALIAATIATQQNDIKKVLAYSTVSQLGFMFMALGVGAYVAAIFHVITHAFFKALLFLGSGSVIHGMGGEQDIRKMGGLKSHMKITYITFFIGCIAIAGIPPLSGFFSKDEIMMHVFTGGAYGKIFWTLGMLAALMTAYYMFRLLFVTFWGQFRGTEDQRHHLHESPALMTVPLVVLAILSVVGGFIGIPAVLGESMGMSHALHEFLKPVLATSLEVSHGEHLSHQHELMLMGIATLIAVAGILMGYFYFKKYNAAKESSGIFKFFENKWYIDELYDGVIVKPLFTISRWKERFVEKAGIDGLVNGIGKLVQLGSNRFRLLQNGLVGFYLFMTVLGVILLFVIQIWYNKF